MRVRFEGRIHGKRLFALLAFLLVAGTSIPVVIKSEWSLGNQNLSCVSFDHFGW